MASFSPAAAMLGAIRAGAEAANFRFGESWGLVAQAEVYEDGHILFVGPCATF